MISEIEKSVSSNTNNEKNENALHNNRNKLMPDLKTKRDGADANNTEMNTVYKQFNKSRELASKLGEYSSAK